MTVYSGVVSSRFGLCRACSRGMEGCGWRIVCRTGALRGSHVLHGCDVLVLVCHRCKFLPFAGLALAS